MHVEHRPFPPVALVAEPDLHTVDASGRAHELTRWPSDPGAAEPPGVPAGGGEIMVRVLGLVEIGGAARPFTRSWSMDLVVYLAMHPRGASNDAWATALWPERVMAPATVHSTASAARRALGRGTDGADHLPHQRGRLRVSPSVGTDWAQFQALAESMDVACWDEALGLVRGRPFEGLRSADWTVLEGFAAEMEGAVAELAIRMAEHRLEAGDGDGMARAARRGLTVNRFDERLYRLLLRAADLQGNPAGVESVMIELGRAVAGPESSGWRQGRAGPLSGDWACDLVHPHTAALYRTLSRRDAATGKVLARL